MTSENDENGFGEFFQKQKVDELEGLLVMVKTQIRNAITEFEDGDYDEGMDTLKGIVGDKPQPKPKVKKNLKRLIIGRVCGLVGLMISIESLSKFFSKEIPMVKKNKVEWTLDKHEIVLGLRDYLKIPSGMLVDADFELSIDDNENPQLDGVKLSYYEDPKGA